MKFTHVRFQPARLSRWFTFNGGIALSALVVSSLVSTQLAVADETDAQKAKSASVLKRVTEDIRYLASDELKGRQPGTPEMKLSEDHIIAAYKKAGLKPINDDGSYLQTFDATRGNASRTINQASCKLTLAGPDDQKFELKLGEQYSQLIHSSTIDLKKLPLVFVGYGIDAEEEHNYDDYGEVDVDGKAVVLIRREPLQKDAESVFDGEDLSVYARLQTKIRSAQSAGAVAILMVNDGVSLEEERNEDSLAASTQFGTVTNEMPFLHVKRAAIDKVLAITPVVTPTGEHLNTLASIEAEIDHTLLPLSQTLPEWQVSIEAQFDKKQTLTSNIIGVIEGEGPHADETIVIGAHYDHLGLGAYGSRSRDAGKAVHNGADDNATGTAAVMELARRFASRDKKPARRIVFICFTAEEMGLLGAAHYVNNPIFPIDQTVTMINFDMIGYLRDDRLTAFGWNTSPQFEPIFDTANLTDLDLVKPPGGFAGSDHLPFNSRQVPNIFFHTGLTDVYHTPADDFEQIDCDGVVRVIDYTERFIDGVLALESRPSYQATGRRRRSAVRLGVGVEQAKDAELLTITSVNEGSAAEKAGIQPGDRILSFGDNDKITSRRRLVRAIQRSAGKSVKVKVLRDGAELLLTVELKKASE